MKYHVAIDLSEERLYQLKVVAAILDIPIRKLVAQIVEEYVVKEYLISNKALQEIKIN